MSIVKVSPPNTISISNIANKELEKKAEKFDVSGKGYLTYDELVAFYQAEKGGNLPGIHDLAKFLGMPQHELKVEHLNGWEVLNSQWFAHDWKGDFHVDAWGGPYGYSPAGHVRTGRQVGPQYNPETNTYADVDQIVFLIDMNLMKLEDFDKNIKSAVLVVGPKGFPKEDGASHGEKVEIPLTFTSQEGYQSYTRFGPSNWVHDKKLLAAQVDTKDLQKLAGADSGELSFYVRLEKTDGKTLYVNKNGLPYHDFTLGKKDLFPEGTP